MTSATAPEKTEVGRKPKQKRDDRAVKIARDLARKAKIIADSKGVSIAEYLSDLLRQPIERDWPKALRQLDQDRPPSAD